MASQDKNSTATKKVTLGNVFASRGLEVLTYIDKATLANSNVVFCILNAKKVDVPESKFDIKEQWVLTIVCQATDESIRKYWLTFVPNEVRDDFMQAVVEGLEEAHKSNQLALHSCVLQAIPNSKYDNPFYALNVTLHDCNCNLDA